MVHVNESTGHDLALAIHDRGILRHFYILPDLRYKVPRDEDISVL